LIMQVRNSGITVETSAAELPYWIGKGYAEVKPAEKPTKKKE